MNYEKIVRSVAKIRIMSAHAAERSEDKNYKCVAALTTNH